MGWRVNVSSFHSSSPVVLLFFKSSSFTVYFVSSLCFQWLFKWLFTPGFGITIHFYGLSMDFYDFIDFIDFIDATLFTSTTSSTSSMPPYSLLRLHRLHRCTLFTSTTSSMPPIHFYDFIDNNINFVFFRIWAQNKLYTSQNKLNKINSEQYRTDRAVWWVWKWNSSIWQKVEFFNDKKWNSS